jgi:hypothetical protein
MLPALSLAAEGLVNKAYPDATAVLLDVVTDAGITITKQASTERFTLIAGTLANSSHVTVTLRNLDDGQQVFAHIGTDSPKNIALENQLLADLNARPIP